MREGFIASVTKLYYESSAEQQPKQEKLELADPSEQDMAMAGICPGMEPDSKASTSVLEMSCVVWHHLILYYGFWLQVKGKTWFINAAVISSAVLEAVSAVIQKPKWEVCKTVKKNNDGICFG